MNYTQCPARDDIEDEEELKKHDNEGCVICMGMEDSDEEEKPGPSVAPEPEETKPLPESRKRKPEVDDGLLELPHKKALHMLKKTEGLSKPAAALKLLEKRREVVLTDKNKPEPSKVEVLARDMPFAPIYVPLPKDEHGRFRNSALSVEDHRRYVAIITNNLKPESAARFQTNNLELKGYDEQLFEERNYFYNLAMEWANNMKGHPYAYESNGSRAFFLKKQKHRFEAIDDLKFGQCIKALDWVSKPKTESAQLLRPKIVQTINEGKIPNVRIPDPRRKCFISANASQIDKKFENEKTEKIEIEKDDIAKDLAFQKNLDIIMDGCTVRTLMTDPYVFRNQQYGFKVEVNRKAHQGQFRKFITVSKPFYTDKLNPITVERQYIKWALKESIRNEQKREKHVNKPHIKEQKMEIDEKLIEARKVVSEVKNMDSDIKNKDSEGKNKDSDVKNKDSEVKNQDSDVKNKDSQDKSKDSETKNDKIKMETLHIEDDRPIPQNYVPFKRRTTKKKEIQPEDIKQEEKNGTDNLLDDILGSMGVDCEKSAPSIKSNYRYSVLRIGEDVKSRLLIRTNNHGRDHDGEVMSLSIKSEYLPSLGAEVIHEEEEIANFMTTLLKDSQKHLVFRVYAHNKAVLQIERKKPANMYSHFEDNTKQLLSHRCERFTALLEYLKTLEVGKYLFIKNNNEMEVFSEQYDGEPTYTSAKIFYEVTKRLLRLPRKRKNKWRKHHENGEPQYEEKHDEEENDEEHHDDEDEHYDENENDEGHKDEEEKNKEHDGKEEKGIEHDEEEGKDKGRKDENEKRKENDDDEDKHKEEKENDGEHKNGQIEVKIEVDGDETDSQGFVIDEDDSDGRNDENKDSEACNGEVSGSEGRNDENKDSEGFNAVKKETETPLKTENGNSTPTDEISLLISQIGAGLPQPQPKAPSVSEVENRFGDAKVILRKPSVTQEELERTSNPHEMLGKPSDLYQGINVRIPLVWQIVQSRIPGSLPPARPIKQANYKGKNKGKWKNKKPQKAGDNDLFGSQIL
ncbi:unnamed protein product [Bursaphelenchus okinawaensis]|uniref:Little elongation complex subunit 2 C-terminal domain-containing protein n=1 Tax=Bursaphelenchus okinawaensis TaxID=465554 RepID=A0A811L1P2_9BILA|nr:unnamed protein product [Bursaphelenchus okinawaensis]CAG9114603.1 unnamed protein product [Bursaphelenchus okinawaensis]